MGEYADAMIDGDVCETCGEWISEGPGHSRQCGYCQREMRDDQPRPRPFTTKHERREEADRQRHRVHKIIQACPRRLKVCYFSGGVHWQGRLDNRVVVDWWPSTGRMIVFQRTKEKKQFVYDAILFAHVLVAIAEMDLA